MGRLRLSRCSAVLANEHEIRLLIAATYQDGMAEPVRPAFRESLIAAVLHGTVRSGKWAERGRPDLELSVVVAAEAVLGLKDQGISDQQAVSILSSMVADVVLCNDLQPLRPAVRVSGHPTSG